jgi:thiamine-monophosphate kinase
MTEFDIIKHYFATHTHNRTDVIHGIGDDAAIVSVPLGHELAITMDTLIEGVHFPTSTLPYDIGYKTLAVNLSDLAAMGATPTWLTLALTMPVADKDWIQAFCEGFFTLANRFNVQLIGGDLTQGPLSITVQAMGLLPVGKALVRSQAKIDDLIYVTGTLGDAALALAYLQEKIQLDTQDAPFLLERFNRPEPRITTGQQLLELAHAAIDISDGLAADLGHILTASQVGATLHVDRLPLSESLKRTANTEKAMALALTGGDDYELCFTISPEKRAALTAMPFTCSFTCIGQITAQLGLNLHYANGNKYHGTLAGYQHF